MNLSSKPLRGGSTKTTSNAVPSHLSLSRTSLASPHMNLALLMSFSFALSIAFLIASFTISTPNTDLHSLDAINPIVPIPH